jgi:hypothetical protein
MVRALIVEDNQETLNRIENSFRENGVDVILCPTIEHANKAIYDDTPFDFVVLDWFFGLEEDSIYSKQFLSRLKNKHFRPVFVYAGAITDYEETSDDEIDFPRNLISGYSKTLPINELQEEINRIISLNYSLQLSTTYRSKILTYLEKIFFDLNELENVDIARILKIIVGVETNVDWSSDLVLNLLHRALISDEEFIADLTRILAAAQAIDRGINVDDRKKIANRILYFTSGSNVLHNGDIVKISNQAGIVLSYGIVVTPDCDLEQKKSLYIELIELRKIDDSLLNLSDGQISNIKIFNNESFYYFPSIKDLAHLQDFVAVLKSKVILKEKVEDYNLKYPAATKRLLYDHDYLLGNEVVKLNLICSITNPYKAEFLQRLNVNNTRVGIPDIKYLFLDEA